MIVTSNLKDFPPQQITQPLTVISPMQSAADTVAVSPRHRLSRSDCHGFQICSAFVDCRRDP